MKTFAFDIELARNTTKTFGGKYEVDVAEFVEYGYMLSFAYKELGSRRVHTVALPDFSTYSKDKTDDSLLAKELHKLFDTSDVLIAHNGARFDVPVANARFIYHGLTPPSSYQLIDTLRIARGVFRFPSNSLDDLADYLGMEGTLETAGKSLWKRCEEGDPKAWKLMTKYNAQDVVVLENVYNKLSPWAKNLPNATNFEEEDYLCTRPGCGSSNIQMRGWAYSTAGRKRQWQCQECGKWCFSKHLEVLSELR